MDKADYLSVFDAEAGRTEQDGAFKWFQTVIYFGMADTGPSENMQDMPKIAFFV